MVEPGKSTATFLGSCQAPQKQPIGQWFGLMTVCQERRTAPPQGFAPTAWRRARFPPAQQANDTSAGHAMLSRPGQQCSSPAGMGEGTWKPLHQYLERLENNWFLAHRCATQCTSHGATLLT